MHLDGAADRFAFRLEPGFGEDTQHRVVAQHHLREELLDADGSGRCGESLQQTCRDSPTLKVVRDRECHLGSADVAEPDVIGDSHDSLVLRPEQCTALAPVGLEHRFDEMLVDARVAVKAEVEASIGQAAKEVEQAGDVLRAGRTKAHRRAVAKDDVGDGRQHSTRRSEAHRVNSRRRAKHMHPRPRRRRVAG